MLLNLMILPKSPPKCSKLKAVPLQAWTGPESSSRLGLPISRQSAY